MRPGLLIYGASGHGKVVADAARASGWEVAGWADDDVDKRERDLAGHRVLTIGVDDTARVAEERQLAVHIAVGDNEARFRLAASLDHRGAKWGSVVHPSAVVASSAVLGEGTFVAAGAVLNPDVVTGRHVIVNTSASVDHDCTLGEFAHVSPGARLGGAVRVGARSHIGIGATLRNGIVVGDSTLIGAGAVVVADVPDGVVAYGVPAKTIRRRSQE